MTTTLTRSIELELADTTDILTVLKQHHGTWSAGLSKSGYFEFMQFQLQQPWSRKNYRYFVARSKQQIVSSCKLYTFDFQSRGRFYKVGGIGAVFTPEFARGNGHANEMMEAMTRLAKKESFDALLLFSDIDPLFYERLGYELLPDNDFHIWCNTPEFERWVMSGPGFVEDLQTHSPELSLVTVENASEMLRHYRRWLASQPYGLVRTEDYWKFKLNRSLYQCEHVEDWPLLELLMMDGDGPQGGYAIFEQGGKILRVLEVVGGDQCREILWRHLLRTALLRRIHLVRGWEASAPDFPRHVRYTERTEWARPMLLPINPETEAWLELDGCPLLELDHF